ncbi:MAG: hypothetical protein JWN95_588 [Frankiales bacterium]|nr:hypothetical protein [Frankiales bacterium]
MKVVLTIREASGAEHDVAVTAAVGTRLDAVKSEIARAVGSSQLESLFVGDAVVPPESVIGDRVLRSGITLGVDQPTPTSFCAGQALQLRVVGGPSAGEVRDVLHTRLRIGRSVDADIRLADPDVSRLHAELQVAPGQLRIRDLGSTNGTTVAGLQITAELTTIDFGSRIQVGGSTLAVVRGAEPPASLTLTSDGHLAVNRPPVLRGCPPAQDVEFPVLVEPARPAKVDWLAALLPAVLSVGLAVLMHNPQFLAFALLSPVTMLAAFGTQTRNWRKAVRIANREFAAEEDVAEQNLRASLAIEADGRRQEMPDPAAVFLAATTPDSRLWERRLGSESFLVVSTGTADLPARTTVRRSSGALPSASVPAVPATVGLTDGPCGIAGPLAAARGTARWLVQQVLVLHSPADCTVWLFTDDDADHWRWARWLNDSAVRIFLCEQTRRTAMDDLLSLMQQRERASLHGQTWSMDWIVVVIDPATLLRGTTALNRVIQDGSRYGITAICVSEELCDLPSSCRSVAQIDRGTLATLSLSTSFSSDAIEVAADQVGIPWCEEVARGLAPLRDTATQRACVLPDTVSLGSLLYAERSIERGIAEDWRAGPHTRVPIGVMASGPVELDLEVDGPHLLIAGSTGSGKSELLRTLVAALAARNAPEHLSFVLIDYKGGAAFSTCEELPHTLGLVTDLDEHLTRRALLSLNAELRRRERLFADAGVAELDTYRRAAEASGAAKLPRLLLVVDEFATLAEELPDFLAGLLGIAQRGRSLGIHLILATQRPTGVVSPQMKANLALRIALRVTDPMDSVDLLGTDSAASLPKDRPGRAVGRFANGLREFQTALVSVSGPRSERPSVTLLDSWHRPADVELPTAHVGSDLSRIVAAVQDLATRHDFRGHKPVRPWLPPLPQQWTPSESMTPAAKSVNDPESADNTATIVLGLVDDPASQAQYELRHELLVGGAIGIIGGPRSGRTTAMRSYLGQLTAKRDSESLHCYIIDCSAGAFDQAAGLPQVGAVITARDPTAIARLIARLQQSFERRQKDMADIGAADLRQAREAGVPMAPILLIIDNWDMFVSVCDDFDAGRTIETMRTLLRDATAAGMTILAAGDRGMLGVRTAPLFGRRFVLELLDASDYAMAGIPANAVPASPGPGRAIATHLGLEVQLPLLDDDPEAATQWSILLRSAQRAEPAPGLGPMQIRPLAQFVSPSQLTDQLLDQQVVALGLGGDDGAPVVIHERDLTPGFLIAGPSRSGRSGALTTIASQLRIDRLGGLVIANARSPLRAWGSRHRLAATWSDDDCGPAIISRFNGDVLIVDDVDKLGGSPLEDAVLQLLVTGRALVVAAGRSEDLLTSYRGVGVELRRNRTGLLLNPGMADGDLLGVRTAAGATSRLHGRGVLVLDRLRVDHPNGMSVQLLAPSEEQPQTH